MKKTIKSLLALAVAAFAFTACSDVPEPDGYNPKQGDGLTTYVPEGTGVTSDPYNVAGVLEATKDLAKGATTSTDIYTKGYVAEVGDFNSSFGNITFYITDSPEGNSKKFYVYRCMGLGGEKFAAQTDLKVGDFVTICGKITNYNGTIEYTQGSKLVQLNDKTAAGGGNDSGETLGTLEAPLTIDQALAEFDKLEDGGKSTLDAIIQGTVSRNITSEANFEKYKNINYYISVDGTENGKEIQVYKGMGLNNAEFTTVTDIKQGDQVIVRGKLYKYKNANTGAVIPEIENGYLLKYTAGTGGGGTESSATPSGAGTQASPFNVAAAVAKCKEIGTTASNEEFYVKGVAAADASVTDATNKNITVDLVDEGFTQKFKAYRVIAADSKKLKVGYKIDKGATVIVYGKLVNYNNDTPEISWTKDTYNGILVSVNGQAPEVDDGTSGGGESGGGTSGGGEVSGNTLTINAADFGFATGVPATTATLSDGTTIIFEKGTNTNNAPQYYDGNYASVRVYLNNTFTITASKNITKIEIITTDPATNGDKYNGSDDAYAEAGSTKVNIVKNSVTNVTFSGLNASTVKVTNYTTATSKNQLRIKTMIITYAN